MTRKDEIKEAYRSLGKANSVYDRMMTGSGLIGKAIDRIVWCMDKEDLLEYQARGMEAIPKDFSGDLLEVPVGTGVLSIPFFKTLPDAKITCLDYSEQMMKKAEQRAQEQDVKNVSFMQGDVGSLPFEDESFDAVISLNGFHAFPDKEAAYDEIFRVLKKNGIFTGCFYVKGENRHTDRIIKNVYMKLGFFTPPFETVGSLKERLKGMYEEVDVSNVKSIVCFACRRKKI